MNVKLHKRYYLSTEKYWFIYNDKKQVILYKNDPENVIPIDIIKVAGRCKSHPNIINYFETKILLGHY